MRDYGKVSPRFWIGDTGKALRGHPEAQLLAIYLMTSPHSEMTGVFYCPHLFMSHETGLSLEAAMRALDKLVEVDFCTFDRERDVIFVHEMATYQIGADLDVKDKRVVCVQRWFDAQPEGLIKQQFFARHRERFALKPLTSPLQGASKPEEGTEEREEERAEERAGAEKEKKAPAQTPTKLPTSTPANLSTDVPTPVPKQGAGWSQAPAAPSPVPGWLPPAAWNAYLATRRSQGLAMSENALGLALKKLGELRTDGNDPQAVLEQSILNGWRGLFPVSRSGPAIGSTGASTAGPIVGPVARPAANRQENIEARNRHIAAKLAVASP